MSQSIPDSVRAAMRERVRGLEPLPGKMLSVAAVIGAVVDIELLRDVLGHSNQFEFLDALDLLLTRQILSETGQARRVSFTHDLIREAAIERQSSTQQTQRLHEAVAQRLENLAQEGKPVSNPKLAEHFLSAGIHDKAFYYLLRSGIDAVSAFAYQDAIRVLEQARQIMPGGTALPQEYLLYSQLARAHAALTTLVSAEAMYREAIRTAPTPADRAEALLGLGEVLARRRQPNEALKVFGEALRDIRHPLRTNPVSTGVDIAGGMLFTFLLPEAVRRKVRLRSRSLQERMLAYRITLTAIHTQMDVSLFRYLQLCQLFFIRAHQTGMQEDLAMAYSKLAFNLAMYGVPFFPLLYSNRALALAATAKRPDAEVYTKSLQAGVRGLTGELPQAISDLEAGMKAFERLGESFTRQLITHVARHLFEFYGDADRERAIADEELRMGRLSDDWEKTTWGLYGRADALARGGDLSQARCEMDKALGLLGDHRSIIARPVAIYSDAFVLLQSSEYETSWMRALESQRLTERNLCVFVFTSKAYPIAVEAGLGPNWHDRDPHSEIKTNKRRMRTIAWVL